MKDLLGENFLGYSILRVLGEGGMGKVYLAENAAVGQRVAIKVLDPVLARNPELRERFSQEARIQIALQHQNIVRIITAQNSDEISFLVMEYIEGESLDKVLGRRGKLSVDEAIKIMHQVLDAVGYANSKGIIHRDLKPSNILVCADGTAKVTDFGIAKVFGDTKLTRTGTAMGSPDYMSPEQVLGKKDIDHRTDIYSLGATLYEMVTGRPPFVFEDSEASDSDFRIKQAHVQEQARAPIALNAEIGRKISDTVMSALSKNPQERFKDCSAFKDALTHAVSKKETDVSDLMIKGSIFGVGSTRLIGVFLVLSILTLMGILIKNSQGIDLKILHVETMCRLQSPDACYSAAVTFQDGEGIKFNWLKARKYYRDACQLGHARSCTSFGDMVWKGQGGERNHQTSIDYYGKSCDGNDSLGCYRLASRRDEPKRFSSNYYVTIRSKFQFLEKACKLKSGIACKDLAEFYWDGLIEPPNENMALEIERKSVSLLVDSCIDDPDCRPWFYPERFKFTYDAMRDKLDKLCSYGHKSSCHRVTDFVKDESLKRQYKEKACVNKFHPECSSEELVQDLESDCSLGHNEKCYSLAQKLEDKSETKVSVLRQACEARVAGACALLFVSLDGKPDTSAIEKRLILEGNCSEKTCENLGDMQQLGIGGGVDMKAALRSYFQACNSERETPLACLKYKTVADVLCNQKQPKGCEQLRWYHTYVIDEEKESKEFQREIRQREIKIYSERCADQGSLESCLAEILAERSPYDKMIGNLIPLQKLEKLCRMSQNKHSCMFFAVELGLTDEARANELLEANCVGGHLESCTCIGKMGANFPNEHARGRLRLEGCRLGFRESDLVELLGESR